MGLVFHIHNSEKFIPYEKIIENRKKKMVKKIREYVSFLRQKYKYFKGITLTFKSNNEFLIFVENGGIAKFFELLRKKLKIKFKYVYVLEVQKRKVFHYHILLALEKRVYLPPLDKVGWWKYGLTRVQNLSIPSNNYLSKYLEKNDQKEVKEVKTDIVKVLAKKFYLTLDNVYKKMIKFVKHMKMFYYSVLDNIVSYSTILKKFKKQYDWKYIIQKDKLGQGFYIVGLSLCGDEYFFTEVDVGEIIDILQEFWHNYLKEFSNKKIIL